MIRNKIMKIARNRIHTTSFPNHLYNEKVSHLLLYICDRYLLAINSLIIELTLFIKSPLAPLCQRVPKAFGIWKREDRRDFTNQCCHYFG
jgi:hypothetical protein